jgi:2-phospho-L-lactate guanylyltransferase
VGAVSPARVRVEATPTAHRDAGQTGVVGVPVDLVVPVKELRLAKSRLVAAVAGLPGSDADRHRAHRDLALALARDTLRAATAAGVRRVVVVTAEPGGLLGVVPDPDPDARTSVEIVDDPGGGLNAAVRHGAAHLRRTARGRAGLVAALQADLPALRPAELDAALTCAAAAIATGAGAAFVADHTGAGTTLLVGAPGRVLRPRFGVGSAAAHAASGAVALEGAWPGLRADVDTPDDLARVRALGTGPATRAWPTAAGGRAAGDDRVNAGAAGCDARPGSLAGSCPLGQNPGT